MSPTRTPVRRLVAVLLLSLVAVLAPVAGPAVAEAIPAPASVGHDVTPSVAAPQSVLPARVAPGGAGPLPDDGAIPAGHPGPQLDALLPGLPDAAPTGPARTAVDRSATAGPDPGHGSHTDPRGPPAA